MKYPEVPKYPNEKQKELIFASLLGDASLDRFGRLKMKLKKTSEEYLLEVKTELHPFTTNEIMYEVSHKPTRVKGKISNNIEDWNGEWCEACLFYTPGFPYFKSLRKKWYPKGKKIVPRDLKVTPYILGHWFCQDGHNSQPRKSCILCTNSFTKNDVDFLIDEIELVTKIKPTIAYHKNKPIISFGARQYHDFLEIIKPHITAKCFQYKVDTSKVVETKKGYGASKLSMEKAVKIRSLYATGEYSQQKIGDMFGVSQAAIGRVVNNVTYKQADVTFGGSATYHVQTRQ
jgi:hypothetical protein